MSETSDSNPPQPGDALEWIGQQPTRHEQEIQRLREFHRTLMTLTPRVFVTPAIVAVNVGVFAVMVFSGVHFFSPSVDSLIRWGADYGPKTLAGEWWRLFTCAFLHIGLLHLLFNMWALWSLGQTMERLVGNTGFLVLYLVSAIGGSVASVLWNPSVVSAGASGAIFGVIGALLGFILWHRDAVPPLIFNELRNSMLACLGYNLFFSLSVKGIDMAAHLGGLVAGFLCGLAMSQRLDQETPRRRLGRNLLVTLCGAAGLAAAVYGMPPAPADAIAELRHFAALEHEVVDAYNTAVQQLNGGQMKAAAFADLIETNILPKWSSQRRRLEELKNVPPEFAGQISRLAQYCKLREEAWQLRAEAIRENDADKVDQAEAKSKAADELARKVGD